MARYTGPKARICRKFGENIFEAPKYDKILKKKGYAPGEHSQGFKKRKSDYGLHLEEKQKARMMYCLMEKQFRNYFKEAAKQSGVTGENLFRLLELRLDSVVFRLGLAGTRMQARQLVSHAHITVNGKRVNIPSYQCKQGDVIQVKDKSKNMQVFLDNIGNSAVDSFSWLTFDKKNLKGEVLAVPNREQIPVNIDDRLIVEFYSK